MQGKYLIVGLGNPGKEYRLTRHNVGFMVIDHLIHKFKIPECNKKDYSLFQYPDDLFYFIKPMTYMNLSGEAVSVFLETHDFLPENIIVFHDDKDIEFGRIKTKIGGGCAGHNGVQDLVDHIGNGFVRIRIGINNQRTRDGKQLRDYVLEDFDQRELRVVDELIPFAEDFIYNISEYGFSKAQGILHTGK